ncbi:MAG: hypothetical protein PHY48_02825 [Candidatus Cloacimonetes bacterium]|nr:hypothetical protein [Candidatus Cloacimonadota bacterium]
MRKALLAKVLCMLLSGVFALSSYGTSAPVANDTVNPNLVILSPNGGEEWYIGDTNDVLWTANDPNLVNNSVNQYYSLNGGTDYSPIAEMTDIDGRQPWLRQELIPSLSLAWRSLKIAFIISMEVRNETIYCRATHCSAGRRSCGKVTINVMICLIEKEWCSFYQMRFSGLGSAATVWITFPIH